ncbi:hypothetical protein AB0I84_13220 [Streptomyces spectabilis]|uniref:hypothetical protein n=1 Tax=Streptomyces spectabilis TaxID=68270 RepID=UPI0033E9B0FD
MYRVDLAGPADRGLTAMPDDVHAEAMALIEDVVNGLEAAPSRAWRTDAVLRGQCWIVYAAGGGLLVVLDAGRVG